MKAVLSPYETSGPAPGETAQAAVSDLVSPDCRGLNFFDIDPALAELMALRLPKETLDFAVPHLRRLGAVAGTRLDELAATADKERNKPVLRTRNRFGLDEDWVDYHPSYREMERIAYSDFGIHAMSRAEGVLGWPQRHAPLVKYAFQYLFVQAEFGLMCPVSVTDSSAYLIERYGNEDVKRRFLPGMTSVDPERLLKGTQFMTERTGGSDVGTNRLRAVPDAAGQWRLYGDKWFCSAVDADVVLLLARPEGAEAGTRGLGLFAMPRRLEDGSRNRYRIARLKDKMGTRSMPSGEVLFEGALAYLVGDVERGLKQMLDQVNLSRLSHGVRAAALMRRCWNEAMVVSNHRVAFRQRLIDHPLHRRQLMKLMLPTEQALSMFVHAADRMQRADAGDTRAALELRILTPLLKFRACRDNIKVATGAMEVRGGNGYIEDFVNERLVRDAHIGVLWEGTSNINALDVVQRAAGKEGGHHALVESMNEWLDGTPEIPETFLRRLRQALADACEHIDAICVSKDGEADSRDAASHLYHAASSALLAGEGARLGRSGGDARRLLISRQVLRHRLGVTTLNRHRDTEVEHALLTGRPVVLSAALELLD